MWQQVLDLGLGRCGRQSGELGEHISQVDTRVVAAGFGAFDQGIGDHSGFAAAWAAGKHPVFTAHGDHAQGSFGGVVVDSGAAVVEIAGKRRPVIQEVVNGISLHTTCKLLI